MSNRQRMRPGGKRRRPRTEFGSAHLGEHLDCGCQMREVLVLDVKPCPDCGDTGETMIPVGAVIPMATSAERTALWQGFASCRGCLGEREVVGEVL